MQIACPSTTAQTGPLAAVKSGVKSSDVRTSKNFCHLVQSPAIQNMAAAEAALAGTVAGMGRRSTHSPEALRQLILDASRDLVEENGLLGCSAREIARKIGYSPGTLYNVFKDLDEVLMTLQIQLLDDVASRLEEIHKGGDPVKRIKDLGRAYVGFAIENKRLWNLLFQHQPPSAGASDKLHSGVNRIAAIIAEAIGPLTPDTSEDAALQAGRTLWAGVHGITAIAVTEKSPTMRPETAQAFADRLITTYIKGLASP